MMRYLATVASAILLSACGSQAPRPVEIRAAMTPAATPAVTMGEADNSVSPAPTDKTESRKPPVVQKRGGGYYKDDGPGDNAPEDLAAIPDAVPKAEPLHRFANNPYSVFGREYVPKKSAMGYRARGIGSWYGRKFHGQKTSSGEIYDMYGMTAAHPTLPIPSYVRVTNPANGKSVVVRVNDRGPFHAGRLIDLSYTAAWKLDYIDEGSTQVIVETVHPGQVAAAPAIAAVGESEVTPTVVNSSIVPAQASLPTVSVAGGHYIQLGAFGNVSNAQALQAHLSRELGEMGEKLVINSSSTLHRLQLGPWPDIAAARNAAQILNDTFGIKTSLAVNASPTPTQ
jgi:rare lipoprotein A